jgi:hypothetical protein
VLSYCAPPAASCSIIRIRCRNAYNQSPALCLCCYCLTHPCCPDALQLHTITVSTSTFFFCRFARFLAALASSSACAAWRLDCSTAQHSIAQRSVAQQGITWQALHIVHCSGGAAIPTVCLLPHHAGGWRWLDAQPACTALQGYAARCTAATRGTVESCSRSGISICIGCRRCATPRTSCMGPHTRCCCCCYCPLLLLPQEQLLLLRAPTSKASCSLAAFSSASNRLTRSCSARRICVDSTIATQAGQGVAGQDSGCDCCSQPVHTS